MKKKKEAPENKLYLAKNIIGYTGDLNRNPTVYFKRGNQFGSITQNRTDPEKNGREIGRSAQSHKILNSGPGGNMQEFIDNNIIRNSKSPFKPVTIQNRDELAKSIRKFPNVKKSLQQALDNYNFTVSKGQNSRDPIIQSAIDFIKESRPKRRLEIRPKKLEAIQEMTPAEHKENEIKVSIPYSVDGRKKEFKDPKNSRIFPTKSSEERKSKFKEMSKKHIEENPLNNNPSALAPSREKRIQDFKKTSDKYRKKENPLPDNKQSAPSNKPVAPSRYKMPTQPPTAVQKSLQDFLTNMQKPKPSGRRKSNGQKP